MRSIWKGAISFGLVSIPVKLYGATQERDVSFHQVHRADGGRIRYKRVCSVDGEEVSYGDIAKGYELDSGEMVVLTDDDFADLPLSTSRLIDVVGFVPLEQVDPMYFTRSYYLEPEGSGTKPYVLLRQALADSGRVALVKVALRQRESLATLRVHDDVFVLELMLWPDEIRSPEFGFLDDEVEVRPQELTMASSLIDSMSTDFDPSQYTDGYREALRALIDAKIEGHEVVGPAASDQDDGDKVVDLMAALRASVDAAKASREGGSAAATRSAGKGKRTRAGSGAPSGGSAKTAATKKSTAAPAPAKTRKRRSA